MKSLSLNIDLIGDTLSNCQEVCAGVKLNRNDGIIPRGLIFESENRNNIKKVVIVCGLNPGIASKDEMEYLKYNLFFKGFKDYWRENLSGKGGQTSCQYYTRMRNFIDSIKSLKGSLILWTDVAKCQKEKEKKKFSFYQYPETCSKCASFYLKKEVEAICQEKVFIALGREVYQMLCLLYPTDKIIGIYHPTGSRGLDSFIKYFEDSEDRVHKRSLKKAIQQDLPKFLKSQSCNHKFFSVRMSDV